MCRDNDHGGRRCPHDTSEARQSRRLAAKERQHRINARLHNAFHAPETLPDYMNLPAVRAYAENLRERLHASFDPDLDEHRQDQIDHQLEEAVTNFGKVIAARVEAAAGFRRAEVEAELDQMEQDIYGNRRERIDALLENLQAAQDDLQSLAERIAEKTGYSIWQVNNWRREKYLEQTDVTPTADELKLLDKLAEIQAAYDAEQAAGENLDAQYEMAVDRIYGRYTRQLALASQRVIAEIRPVGGDLVLHEFNMTHAEQMLKTTVGLHYPSDWLAWHNKTGETVQVLETSTRARYTVSQADDDNPVAMKQLQYVRLPTDKLDQMQALLNIMPDNARRGVMNDSNESDRGMTLFTYQDVRQDVYIRRSSYADITDAELEAAGWVYGPTIEGLQDERLDKISDPVEAAKIAAEPRWHRPRKRPQNVQNLIELYSTDLENDIWEKTASTTSSVAYHEFAHRIEHVAPNNLLARTERAFLIRRAGKAGMDRADQYDNMIGLSTGSGEFAHANLNMVASYMAREYYLDNAFEVFSCGVESVYGQGYGSLLGLSDRYTHQDDEHRAYTLGVLAAL